MEQVVQGGGLIGDLDVVQVNTAALDCATTVRERVGETGVLQQLHDSRSLERIGVRKFVERTDERSFVELCEFALTEERSRSVDCTLGCFYRVNETCDLESQALLGGTLERLCGNLLGKLLDVMLLDPIENELRQLEIVNALLAGGKATFGDDFIEKLAQAAGNKQILRIATSVTAVSWQENEHIWYSASQVKDVGNVIFSALETVDRNSTPIYESNLAEFEAQIKLIEIRTAQITETWGGAKVFATEPLIYYLLQDTGMVDITPAEFSEAIEEERDVAPAVMLEAQDAVMQAKFIAVNSSTRTAQIDQVLSDASATAFGFGELLPQDPDTGEYQGDYFEMMASALDMIVDGARP